MSGAGHKELGDFHLETVARTNMMMAYGVGRRKQMEEVSGLLPYWQRNAVNDSRTRPAHRAMDGLVFPADNEFWDTHYPPDDFRCRCSVSALLDYPADYNHRKPNPDTTIAYDENGQPAKVEYLTQVVDLKAIKFVGVPKSANLGKALVEAASAAKDVRLLNHQNIPQVVVDQVREIRRGALETVVGWDKKGNLIGQFVGDAESVSYPYRIEPLLEDGFDLHNHPPENGVYFESPSPADFEEMVRLKKKVSYVITRNFLYQVRVPKNGWLANAIDDFYESYERNRAKIAVELNHQVRNGTLEISAVEDIERHLIWKEVAKELKFKYKRFKVSEL